MRPRVFLHVGSPKTGTTFLQDVLWTQRSKAEEQGLLLPGKRFNDHFLATLDVRGLAEDAHYPPQARGMWERLVAEANAWDGNALISHELFSGADAEQARRAVDAFGDGVEVHVVVTARDLVRQIAAEWQEHVKHRSAATFGDFVRGVRDDHAHTSWFWQVQDYASVLERWGATLPREQVHVVTVPPAGSDPTILWERFAGVLGVDPAAFDTELERSNSSLGAEQAELLRRVNVELGARLPLPGPYPLVVKNVLSHRVLEPRPGTRLTLDAADEEYAAGASRAVAERLEAMGVDVVGDLGDLVPAVGAAAREPGAGGYAAPSDAALLAESVAAIADLLVVLNERRASQQRAEDLATTARQKPVRFALVQASENRPVLRRMRGAYRALKARRQA